MKLSQFIFRTILISSLISCHKDKNNSSVWHYNGSGDGNIDSTKNATISFEIKSNLNVNGDALLKENASVLHDLNLNQKGRVVVLTKNITDTVYVDGNANIDDTLLIQRGIVRINHDLNINSKGVLNCSNDAQIIVDGSLNQAGTLWGLKRIKVLKATNINNKQTTYDNPIPYYSTSLHY